MSDKRAIEGWETAVIKNVVSRMLIEYPKLKREGFEDLESECRVYWFENREACDYKNKENPKSFLAKVVKNHLLDVKNKAYAAKRKLTYESESLERYFENTDSESQKKYEPPAPIESVELRLELSAAFEILTTNQKAIFRLLYEEGMSPLQASKRLKRHHNYVYREKERIKQLFESKGLKEYLDES